MMVLVAAVLGIVVGFLAHVWWTRRSTALFVDTLYELRRQLNPDHERRPW